MGLEFCPVETDGQIEELAEMAAQIWGEYWPSIIGQDQTDYMVEKFQSVEAITRDLREHNYRYWVLREQDGHAVGFTGGAVEEMSDDPVHNSLIHHSDVIDEKWPRRFFISKIYLYKSERGKHYASRVIEFYEKLCRDEGFPVMYLTVNRGNELGIRAYLGRGFEIVDEVDSPIGHGFVMN
ncbi:MAG: GNAT family N-acetyltransferase, partial [Coriobacteriales bacterium]